MSLSLGCSYSADPDRPQGSFRSVVRQASQSVAASAHSGDGETWASQSEFGTPRAAPESQCIVHRSQAHIPRSSRFNNASARPYMDALSVRVICQRVTLFRIFSRNRYAALLLLCGGEIKIDGAASAVNSTVQISLFAIYFDISFIGVSGAEP